MRSRERSIPATGLLTSHRDRIEVSGAGVDSLIGR